MSKHGKDRKYIISKGDISIRIKGFENGLYVLSMYDRDFKELDGRVVRGELRCKDIDPDTGFGRNYDFLTEKIIKAVKRG